METRTAQALWLCGMCVVIRLLFVMAPSATKDEGAVRIDTHSHYIPQFYREILAERQLTAGGYPIPPWSVEAHLAANEKYGVKTSILSVSTPGAKLDPLDSLEDGRKLARELNEFGYNLTQEYPENFKFFATLTLPDVEGAVAEAIYALDTLKAAGVIVLANAFGDLLGGSHENPLFEVLDEREAIVFIHPSNSPCPPSANPKSSEVGVKKDPPLPAFVLDFLLDTARAAANLAFRNVTGRFPNIRFILAHSGGFLPFAAHRVAATLSLVKKTSEEEMFQQLQTMYADVAISATDTALPSSLAFFPANHLTFGSDFPFLPLPAGLDNLARMKSYKALSNAMRTKINFSNARSLLSNTGTRVRSSCLSSTSSSNIDL